MSEREETKEERKARKRAKKEKAAAEEANKESKKQKQVKEEEEEDDDKEETSGELDTFKKATKAFPKAARDMFKQVTKRFDAPTEIQAKTWGPALESKDVIGIAATGSGKTFAFILPIVSQLMGLEKKKKKGRVAQPRSLVLAPTRELCSQGFVVAKEACDAAELASVEVYGGQPRHVQLNVLQQEDVDILFATPGRLIDFLDSGDISLQQCRYLVLDEADRMLDMGFERDMRRIFQEIPRETRQTLMYSATWPETIRSIAKDYLKPDAIRVTIGSETLKANEKIVQSVRVLDVRDKDRNLFEILSSERNTKIIIFALYKKEAERVYQNISRRGFKVSGVHGDKSQSDREKAVKSFAQGEVNMLVATDVASRGLDIKGVELVINYTFPLTIEDYVHRIGRTGRAGASGRAMTFFTEHDKARAGELQNVLKEAGAEVPSDLLKFGSTVKKKTHALFGSHFKQDEELASKSATITTFDDDDSD